MPLYVDELTADELAALKAVSSPSGADEALAPAPTYDDAPAVSQSSPRGMQDHNLCRTKPITKPRQSDLWVLKQSRSDNF